MPQIDLPPALQTFVAAARACVAGSSYVVLSQVENVGHFNVYQQTIGGGLDPEWYTTPAWQALESEADADIAAGRLTVYLSDEDFLGAH